MKQNLSLVTKSLKTADAVNPTPKKVSKITEFCRCACFRRM